MNDTASPRRANGFVRAGLAHIVAWAVCWGVMTACWRMNGSLGWVWAVLSVGAILLTAGGLVLTGLVAMVRRSRRWLTILLLVVFLSPTLLFVGRLHLTRQKLSSRQDTRIGMFERVLGVWAASFVDVHARIDLPYRVEGEHVVLLHNHDLTAEQLHRLVDQADAYIAELNERLGVAPPGRRVSWARGKMLGFQGRALREWAICPDEEGTPEKLMRLDRHEIAHVVIHMHCGPDTDPPLLLVEGWAEAVSRDHTEMFDLLSDRLATGERYTLRQLVGPGWYTSPRDKTVYHYGGPFVLYLLERFGGERFLDLYSAARRDSFIPDSESILDIAWDELEADFWVWLDHRLP